MAQEQILRMLPIIIRLAPQLVKQTFYRGSAVVANKIDPATDEALERDLNRKIKRDPKQESKDNQMCIKVSEAVNCVEKHFNNTTLVKEFMLTAAKSLFEGRTTEACGQRLFDQMTRCIRENALRQDTPRAAHRTTKHGRPARGHGRGRSGF
jgi:hypothetical protein